MVEIKGHQRVGVIGAGQLGRMLLEAADRMGLAASVLAARPDDPGALGAKAMISLGDVGDPRVLADFVQDLDVVAFEQESKNPSVLTEVQHHLTQRGARVNMRPSLAAFAFCSDKLQQKYKLGSSGLPTAHYSELGSDGAPCEAWLEGLPNTFNQGFVLKWARSGYDGLGTLFVQPNNFDRGKAERFARVAVENRVPLYAEEAIAFVAELAVVAVRSMTGTVATYPSILTYQKNGVCAAACGPAERLGVSPAVAEAAQELAREVGALFDLIGTYAVEFFVTVDDRLVINEIAPRVHNSGHFTLDAARTSQFENHWRALLGLELGSMETSPFFGMVNILGPDGPAVLGGKPFAMSSEGIMSYWYDKRESRPGRKLGHVNVFADSEAEFSQRLSRVKFAVAEWQEQISG